MSEVPAWKHIDISRANGVTEARLHTNGASLIWTAFASDEIEHFFHWVAGDEETKVVILTGSGDDFCAELDAASFGSRSWRQVWASEQRLLSAVMDLNTIVISALNGPVMIHSDIPVLADIVLACPEAAFGDPYHFKRNVVPGDGVQLVWGTLLGSSRANYFFLTNQRLSAEDAKQVGAVHEIHPRDELLTRARELARTLAEKPTATLTYSKAALRLRDRRDFREDLSHSLALQGLALNALGYSKPE